KESLNKSSCPRRRASSPLIFLGSRLRGNDGKVLIQSFPKLRILRWGELSLTGFLLVVCAVGMAGPRAAKAAVPGTITSVKISNVSGESCQQAPVTFGQPFRKGDLQQGEVV